MATIRLRRHTILRGSALWASLAAFFSVEAAAQPWPAPEHPLSEAVAEALQSPLHGDRAPPGSPGHDLLPSSTAYPRALPGRAGVAALLSPQPPGARIPVPAGAPSAEDGTPSRGKVFLLTTLTAAAGHAWTFYWSGQCAGGDPPFGGPAAPFANPAAATEENALCPTDNETALFLTGGLATVMMTGGVATLAGRDLWRSLAGSALGYAVGLAAANRLELVCDEECGESARTGLFLGGLILGHSALTTLLFN